MTTYLCTSGTSAAKNIPDKPFEAGWVDRHGGIEAAAGALLGTFAKARMDDDAALRGALSAEIHSLARMKVTDRDRVVLYGSETLDGQACAHAVRRYLTEIALPGVECRVEVVKGLQVTDAQRFQREGVLEFVKAVIRDIERYGAAHCVLNPTGGFKSLVPYTVLIGMLKGVPARYIFVTRHTGARD